MKVSTWNIQGNAYAETCSTFAEAKARMLKENIDVFCLQEVGPLLKFRGYDWTKLDYRFPDFYCAYNVPIGTQSRGKKINIYYVEFGKVNFRCSMAILVNSEMDSGNWAYINPLINCDIRPVIGILLKNNVGIYNIHAPSGNDKFAKHIIDNTIIEINRLKQGYNIGNVLLIGDFNCSPLLFSTNELALFQMKTYYNVDNNNVLPTQRSGNCLDYCISSDAPYNMAISNNGAFSDHSQVSFEFNL